MVVARVGEVVAGRPAASGDKGFGSGNWGFGIGMTMAEAVELGAVATSSGLSWVGVHPWRERERGEKLNEGDKSKK